MRSGWHPFSITKYTRCLAGDCYTCGGINM
jgi:hypothetical protein